MSHVIKNKKCQNKYCNVKKFKDPFQECGHCFKQFCKSCSEKSTCECGFLCKPCRKELYTRECFFCSEKRCNQLLCQECVTEICSSCDQCYCKNCDYGNISHCGSCEEIKCNYCMNDIPSDICLHCLEIE